MGVDAAACGTYSFSPSKDESHLVKVAARIYAQLVLDILEERAVSKSMYNRIRLIFTQRTYIISAEPSLNKTYSNSYYGASIAI